MLGKMFGGKKDEYRSLGRSNRHRHDESPLYRFNITGLRGETITIIIPESDEYNHVAYSAWRGKRGGYRVCLEMHEGQKTMAAYNSKGEFTGRQRFFGDNEPLVDVFSRLSAHFTSMGW